MPFFVLSDALVILGNHASQLVARQVTEESVQMQFRLLVSSRNLRRDFVSMVQMLLMARSLDGSEPVGTLVDRMGFEPTTSAVRVRRSSS